MQCKNIGRQKQNFQRGKCKLTIKFQSYTLMHQFFSSKCVAFQIITVCWEESVDLLFSSHFSNSQRSWVVKILTTPISEASLCILRTTSYWTMIGKRWWQITVRKILSATILILFSLAAVTLFKMWSCIAGREGTDLKAYSHSLWSSTLKVHLQTNRTDMGTFLSRE